MTKEGALKKINELKEYVEKCEEKEKEIPEMPQHGNYNVHIAVPDELNCPYSSWERSFENQESSDLYCILSFELANLIYVRNYLGIKNVDTTNLSKTIWRVWFCPDDKMYYWTRYRASFIKSNIISDGAFTVWFFEKEDDANRVRDYMNKYVKDIKKNMY